MPVNVRTMKIYEIPVDEFKRAFGINENFILSVTLTESGNDIIVHAQNFDFKAKEVKHE